MERSPEKDPYEPTDYSHEVKLHRSALVRYTLATAGTISVGLGILGIILPLLPTTPFLLLAAICYANSSERFYNWIMNHRHFGSYIRNWRIHGTIPRGAKVLAIALIIVTIGSSIIFIVPLLSVKILLGCIGLAVIAYLLTIPTSAPLV